jgi:DNA-binding CsgD family transcriptional regulator
MIRRRREFRRRSEFRDPTGRRAVSRALTKEVQDRLLVVMATLSERESGIVQRWFGLWDGRRYASDEIAQVYGVSYERIRQLKSKVMSKLRHPIRSKRLRDLLDDELVIPGQVRAPAKGCPLIFCDRHGWSESYPGMHQCEQCHCFVVRGWKGRPRRYCSGACRQAAYRRRKRPV